jgi:serine/threonine protein kinase
MIHEKKLVHRDFHSGNILMSTDSVLISDMGLCRPADYKLENTNNNNLYGVLPYVAPEILRGRGYTQAADIYSFGIIMYEVISGFPPYHDVEIDEKLALNICKGLRPKFNIKVPELIVQLINRCLDADPLKRPTANEIMDILHLWYMEFDNQVELKKQIKEADEFNSNLQTSNIPSASLGLSYKTGSQPFYESILLSNLEPKKSDDYNIMSQKILGN